VIAKVKAAGIFIATQPLTNLYLQGGGGRVPGPRGLTRVRDLWQAGVTICCASDNIQDPFNPYGNGDPLLAALIAGLALRMGSPADQAALLGAITEAGAAAMGLEDYGLRVGARADLVALACTTPTSVIGEQPARKLVVLNGRCMPPATAPAPAPGLAV
jgi:cytosine deaminase